MINADKLFSRMQTQPLRAIDKKPRNVLRIQFADSEKQGARLAERMVISQIDVVAAVWNSQLAIGYWELRRMFEMSRRGTRR